AEQNQLHDRDADDHRQRDAVAAHLPQLLHHDREQAAGAHAASCAGCVGCLPRVAATKTSSRLGSDGSTVAATPAPRSTSAMRPAASPFSLVSTRSRLSVLGARLSPGAGGGGGRG